MNNDTFKITSISMLFTTMFVKYFNIESYNYMNINTAFTLIITEILSYSSDYSFSMIYLQNTNWYLYLLLFCFIFYCRKYSIILLNKIWYKKYIKLELYENRIIFQYIEYVNKNKNMFDLNVNHNIGDGLVSAIKKRNLEKGKEYSFFLDVIIPENNSKVYFNDTNFNVKGYYTIIKKVYKIDEEKDFSPNIDIDCLQLYIDKNSKLNIVDYYKEIVKFVIDKKNDENIFCYHYKILSCNKIEVQLSNYLISSGPPENIQKLEKLYIDTLFHPEKNYIWNFVKNVHLNPQKFIDLGQCPRASFLFYGAPGSGKSNFAYRIARALTCHIISIDFATLTNKSIIYKLFRRPDQILVHYGMYDNENIIYILDEFDYAVKYLYEKSKHNKEIKKKKIELLSGKDEKELKELKEFDIDDELTLDDLLELLQGPVNVSRLKIFATTNDIEGIRKICPMLLRHGRLTPVEFTYLTDSILDEITVYYFNIKLSEYLKEKNIKYRIKDEITISRVIEYVTSSKMKYTEKKDEFIEYFKLITDNVISIIR